MYGVDSLRQAVEAEPFDASLRVELGDRLAMSGDDQGALAAYRDALGIQPSYSRAMSRKAALETRLENHVPEPPVESSPWLAIALCLAFLAASPPASKAVLSRRHLSLPVTLATAQLGGAASAFIGVALLRRWLLGLVNPLPRLRDAAPVGCVFGAKLALMNVGLAKSSTVVHVLLQSTDVLWSAGCARCVTAEPLGSSLGGLALAGCALGAGLVAFGSVSSFSDKNTVIGLIANLTSPAMQGLVIALLRSGVVSASLHQPDLFLVEFTALKLLCAFATALGLAFIVEGALCVDELVNQWALLSRYDFAAIALATACVAAIQLSFTLLAALVSAPTIGVVAATKVVPQATVAAIIAAAHGHPVAHSRLDVAGAAVIVFSAVLWAADANHRRIAPSSTLSTRRRAEDDLLSPS